MRLIDADALIEKFAHPPELIYTSVVAGIIREEPTIDAGLPDSASIISLDDLVNREKDSIWLETIGGDLTQLTKDEIAVLILAGAVCGFNNYGSVWRCWNAEPTDEQRKAVAWQ